MYRSNRPSVQPLDWLAPYYPTTVNDNPGSSSLPPIDSCSSSQSMFRDIPPFKSLNPDKPESEVLGILSALFETGTAIPPPRPRPPPPSPATLFNDDDVAFDVLMQKIVKMVAIDDKWARIETAKQERIAAAWAAQKKREEANIEIFLMDAFKKGESLHRLRPPPGLAPSKQYSSLRGALGTETPFYPAPPPPKRNSSLDGALGLSPIRTEKASSSSKTKRNPYSRDPLSKGQQLKDEARATRS